jgi:glycosyltransferase involved in cell wall biosynthesis
MIRFSIITPVYNGGNLLRETLNSVLNNCNPDLFEYIVVNDGSTDQTSQVLSEFTGRIIVLNTKNQGEANAVNMGLRIAKGEYSLVVSADDPLISSELFDYALSIFESDASIVAVYPDWNMIDSNSKILSQVNTIEYSKQVLIGYFICIPGPGTIFRTSAAKQIGGRNTKLKFGSDYDFWMRLSQLGDFKRIPKVLAQWRNHPDSTSISNKGLEMAKERIFVMDNFLTSFPQSKTITRSARAHSYYHAALLSYFSKDVPGAAWMFKAFLIRRGWIEKADLRIVIYCLLLPYSRFILPLLLRLPVMRALFKRRKSI